MSAGVKITPQQAMTLATHAHRGPAQLVPLGFADREDRVVAHYPDSSLLIETDGRVADDEPWTVTPETHETSGPAFFGPQHTTEPVA